MSETDAVQPNDMQVDAPAAAEAAQQTPVADAPAEAQRDQSQSPENADMEVEQKEQVFVLGVDFGTQKCVAALTRNGEVLPRIVQNNLANQVTPNVVSFPEGRRFIGEEALGSLIRLPRNTFHSIKRLVGRPLDEAHQELSQSMLTYQLAEESGQTALQVSYCGESTQLRPELIAAMMLKKLQGYAVNTYQVTGPIKGCVLAVPACFTIAQRRALADAAKIAGLNVMRLIDEATAVALCYGMKRRELAGQQPPQEQPSQKTAGGEASEEGEGSPSSAAPTEDLSSYDKVLFVDMGHSYLSVQLVAFGPKKLKVLSSVSDPRAGAWVFDQQLVRHFGEELKQKHGIDVYSNPRAMAKLLVSSEKTKKVLSTIDETLCEVDNVGDVDFRSKISRAKFEELGRELLQRVGETVERVISASGVSIDDVLAVEIVGGGTRIPSVQAKLSQVLGGKQLSRTLDSAGSVALGAAIMAGILSSEIDMEYEVEDGSDRTSEQALASGVEGLGMSDREIEECVRLEQRMQENDERIAAEEHKRNEIEQLIYNYRERAEDKAFEPYMSAEEKNALFKVLDEARIWVDDHREGTTLEELTEKYEDLKRRVDEACPRMRDRLQELEEERQKALREAEEMAKQPKAESSDKKPRSKPQKIAAAEKKRQQGNLVFKEFDYQNAARIYAEALNYLADIYDASPQETEQINNLKVPLHLNLAACLMKIDRHRQAMENCSKALAIDAKNIKAMFRRGQCYAALKQWEEAKNDFTEALNIEPENSAVKKELARANRAIAQQKEKEKKMYAKMFA